jgi:hypothetical protein
MLGPPFGNERSATLEAGHFTSSAERPLPGLRSDSRVAVSASIRSTFRKKGMLGPDAAAYRIGGMDVNVPVGLNRNPMPVTAPEGLSK